MRKAALIAVFLFYLSQILGACAPQGLAETAIEAYLEALVSKDVIRAVNISCLDWEEGAHAEASSFEAVIVRLEGVACHPAGESGDQTKVDCEGKIIANYGGEDQDILLSERTYLAVVEDGEWKMCGYETGRGE